MYIHLSLYIYIYIYTYTHTYRYTSIDDSWTGRGPALAVGGSSQRGVSERVPLLLYYYRSVIYYYYHYYVCILLLLLLIIIIIEGVAMYMSIIIVCVCLHASRPVPHARGAPDQLGVRTCCINTFAKLVYFILFV